MENAANTGVVTTESEDVEVDEWLVGGGCIELNRNTPRSSSDLCALVADGDGKKDGICECDRGEAKRFRFCGGEYGGWGPDARLSSAREGGKDEDAHREDHGCPSSWLSWRCGNG